MDAPVKSPLKNWFSGLLLASLTLWLLVVRPGQLAPSRPYADLLLMGSLTGMYVLYLVNWKTHGIVYGIVSLSIFLLSDRLSVEYPTEAGWHLLQVAFIACFGLHVVVWTSLSDGRTSSVFWIIAAACMVALLSLLWIEAERTRQFLNQQHLEGWIIADQRNRICAFILSIAGGIACIWYRGGRSAAAWIWGIICLLAPVAGYGVAMLFGPVSIDAVINGGHWERIFADHSRRLTAVSRSDLEGWCWTTPSIVLTLGVIGMLRCLFRGFAQRRKRQMPTAWLLLGTALLLLMALLPTATGGLRPYGLFVIGIALSVYAIADLALAIYERIALEAPEPGPSDVPRV